MNRLKVLLVYPNLMLVSLLPNNIAVLTSALKNEGYEVNVFDTTLYRTAEKTNDELRVERMQVRKFNINEAGLKIKKTDMYADFARLVNDFKPDLIGVSVVDDTVDMGVKLIEHASCEHIPVIFGGVHAIFNPEELIKKPRVHMICVGEGEHALLELCDCIAQNLPYDNIKNLWIKKNIGTIVKNGLRSPVDLDHAAMEDFTVFEKQRLFRPMQGKMISMIPINFDRGCPYRCSFCDAPSIYDYYKKEGFGYYRVKSIQRIRDEMKYQINRFPVSYFYFNSETFLSMSMKKMEEFAEMYAEFNLPFWCQTRIETITDAKIKLLKKINCDRISVGLEHGNEEFRKKILKKSFTNKQAIDAFNILNKYHMKISVNNMLGFPDETRELVFDTINLNRQIKADSINGFVFQPYSGTYLKDYCIKKGYLDAAHANVSTPIGSTVLTMPQFSKEQIEGLLRTFVLYVKMPKKYYPRINKAEELTEEGDRELSELRKIFFEELFV
ncbi:MAG: radical SAM protein [bacterium]